MRTFKFRRTLLAATVIGTYAGSYAGASLAADGFKVRFPLSGTLGGEIVAQVDNPGFFASVSLTQIEIDKITDGTGNSFQQDKSGNFATPAPSLVPCARPPTAASSASI